MAYRFQAGVGPGRDCFLLQESGGGLALASRETLERNKGRLKLSKTGKEWLECRIRCLLEKPGERGLFVQPG